MAATPNGSIKAVQMKSVADGGVNEFEPRRLVTTTPYEPFGGKTANVLQRPTIEIVIDKPPR